MLSFPETSFLNTASVMSHNIRFLYLRCTFGQVFSGFDASKVVPSKTRVH